MSKLNAKTIAVKCLLSADDFTEFNTACDGEPHSSVLRRLAKNFTRRRANDMPAARHRERPKAGRNMAMFFPGRVAVPAMHRRL